jgi:hypothetical protein
MTLAADNYFLTHRAEVVPLLANVTLDRSGTKN